MKKKTNNYCKTTRQTEKNVKEQKRMFEVGQGKTTGHRTYERNIEARSQNRCWRGRVISITYSECVYVALVIWYVQRMLPNISSPVGCLALLYFSILSHKLHEFWRKKMTKHNICALIFAKNLSETLLILRRIQRDIIVKVYRSSCEVPVILVGFQ